MAVMESLDHLLLQVHSLHKDGVFPAAGTSNCFKYDQLFKIFHFSLIYFFCQFRMIYRVFPSFLLGVSVLAEHVGGAIKRALAQCEQRSPQQRVAAEELRLKQLQQLEGLPQLEQALSDAKTLLSAATYYS